VKIAPTTTMIMVWSIAAMAVTGFSVSQQIASADSPGAVAPSGFRPNHEGMTWPPQPRDITNVVVHSNIEQEKKGRALRKDRIDRLEAKTKTNPGAKQALGKQFTRITVIDREDKGTGTVVRQLVFFSRERNATVEVNFDKDEELQTTHSIPAWEYQPEITDEEAEEAAALARTYFLSQGFVKIADLKAFAILAYKPKGVGFFDTRVLYVSFHKQADAIPELTAWVDLSNQLVFQTLGDH
jgi:hypothetical protein